MTQTEEQEPWFTSSERPWFHLTNLTTVKERKRARHEQKERREQKRQRKRQRAENRQRRRHSQQCAQHWHELEQQARDQRDRALREAPAAAPTVEKASCYSWPQEHGPHQSPRAQAVKRVLDLVKESNTKLEESMPPGFRKDWERKRKRQE